MSQPASNALLPPMEADEFKATYPFCLLIEHDEYRKEVCDFLSADNLDNLAFTANPCYGFHTQYDQQDFDEILDYLRQYGKCASQSLADGFYRYFQPLETPVGKFIFYKHVTRGILGILSA